MFKRVQVTVLSFISAHVREDCSMQTGQRVKIGWGGSGPQIGSGKTQKVIKIVYFTYTPEDPLNR